MNVLSLFDGISCGQIALAEAGVPVGSYFASEIDPVAIHVTQANHPRTVQLGDVAKVRGHNLPRIDLLIGGSPCQGFSKQGKRTGFKHASSSLYREYLRVLKETKPTWFFFENVTMDDAHAQQITADLGVAPIQINSRYWTPQNRERLYWTNIPCTLSIAKKAPKLSKLVGKGYEGIYAPPHGYFKGGFKSMCEVSPCVTKSGWLASFFVVQNGKQRKFVLSEVEALQGLPDGYTAPGGCVSTRVRLIGEGWTVPVVASVFSGLHMHTKS